MLYPFYVKHRVIDLKIWPNCLTYCSARMGQGDLYIGDSEGRIKHLHLDTDVKMPRDMTPVTWHTSVRLAPVYFPMAAALPAPSEYSACAHLLMPIHLPFLPSVHLFIPPSLPPSIHPSLPRDLLSFLPSTRALVLVSFLTVIFAVRQTAAHTLGVLQMGAEAHEGLLLSISNDTTVKLWEQATGAVKKSLKNGNRVRFNAMCINSHQQEVMLVDDVGWLHIWSWVSERLVFSDRIVLNGSDPLFGIGCNQEGTEVYVRRAQSVDSFMIIRGISRVALKGHEAPIVGVGYLRPGKEEIVTGDEILYSCSHDNTLRSWDPLTMQCSNVHRFDPPSDLQTLL